MSRTPTRLPLRRRPGGARHVSSLGLGLASALVLAFAGVASAQVAAPPGAKPTPPDTRPLARYVPGEKLALFAGSEGLDNHAAAWGKTAAQKMLNETTLGEMLEALAGQLAEKRLSSLANKKATGADLVAALKHAAKQGFVVAAGTAPADGGKPAQEFSVLVIRGAAGREVIGPFGRLIGTMMGASKAAMGKKGTRNVVSVPAASPGSPAWVWWTEGRDLVIGTPGTEDVVAAVIDGQRKNAVDLPALAALAKPEGSFEPLGYLLFDARAGVPGGPVGAQIKKVAALGIQNLDYRWGFENEALMTVARVDAPKPRQGLLALFDQPTFERAQVPPVPEGIGAFTAVSLDTAKLVDVALGAIPVPDVKTKVGGVLDEMKTKSRVDLRKDLLSHIGPRMVVYVMPGGAAPKAGAEAGSGAPAAAANPLAGLLTGNPLDPAALASLSGAQIPRITLVAEIDDPVAFGKTLDNLMVAVNHDLKAKAAEAAEAAAPAEGGEAAKGAGRGEAKGKAKSKAGGSRRDAAEAAAVEFKLMPGKDKVYVLTVPSSLAKSFPAGFRPTIRLGAKHVALSVAPDAARLALEVKPGAWSPPSEIAATLDALPKNLMLLSVSDPRTTAPELLASLPRVMQTAVNAAVVSSQARAAGAAAATATASGGPGPEAGGSGGGPGSGGKRGMMSAGPAGVSGSGGPPSGYPGATSGSPPSGYPGSSGSGGPPSGYPGAMSGGGSPGQGQGQGEASSALLQFNIDASKLPKADDLRSKMFPSTTHVAVDDQRVTFVSRASFPDVVSAASAAGVMVAKPAIEAARASGAQAGGAGGPGGPGQPNLGPMPGMGSGSGPRPTSMPGALGGGLKAGGGEGGGGSSRPGGRDR